MNGVTIYGMLFCYEKQSGANFYEKRYEAAAGKRTQPETTANQNRFLPYFIFCHLRLGQPVPAA